MSTRIKRMFDKTHNRQPSLKVMIVAGATVAMSGLLLTSVALAVGSPPTSAGSRNPLASVTPSSPWTTPQNELNSPAIPIPGGATQGLGAFNSVACPSASLCVAVGGDANLSAIVATTTDEGSTWGTSAVPGDLPELNAVSCSSSSQCVAVGSGVAITSMDGGATWSAHSIPTSNTTLLGVDCPSANSCIAVGVAPDDGGPLTGEIITSSDGGVTWRLPTTTFPLGAIGGVSCASSSFCVAVGAQILVSTDGGQTWTQKFVESGTGELRSVSCGSSTTCVAIGANPLGAIHGASSGFEIQTDDGGAKWTSGALPAGSWTINALSCADANDCVLSGPSPTTTGAPAWTSTDGGSTWSASPFPSTVTAVSSLSCVSLSSCIYVGTAGSNATSGASTDNSGWTSNPDSSTFSAPVGGAS